MKKIVAILLSLLMVSVLAVAVNAEEPAVDAANDVAVLTAAPGVTLTATPVNAELVAGSEFTVNFVISNNTGIMALQMKPVTVEGLTLTAENGTLISSLQTGSSLVWLNTADVTANGTLYTVKGTIPATAAVGTVYTFKAEVELCSDSNENAVEINSVEGTVTVACAHATTEVVDAVAATCTAKGYTGDTVCKVCGKKTAEGKEIASLGHTGGAASCVKKAVCTRCGAEYGELDTTKHGATELKGAAEATSQKEGYTGDTVCKDCGAVLVKGAVIPMIINPPTGDNGVIVAIVMTVIGLVSAASAAIVYNKRREF